MAEMHHAGWLKVMRIKRSQPTIQTAPFCRLLRCWARVWQGVHLLQRHHSMHGPWVWRRRWQGTNAMGRDAYKAVTSYLQHEIANTSQVHMRARAEWCSAHVPI
jgi:hypothetical protein